MNKNKLLLIVLIIIFIAQLSINLFNILKPKTKTSLEIERKFLINKDDIPYNLSNLEKHSFEQAYINFSPEIRIRNADDNLFMLTIKASVDDKGLIREEKEFIITQDEYLDLLNKMEGNIITKDRYYLYENGHLMSIDIYSGNLIGLAVLEIEFKNEREAESFVPPTWIEKEVTQDKSYKNSNLARYGLDNK